MSSQKTDDYVQVILNGLTFISRQNIQISCVVCDGNTAQKKAFSQQYKSSLRHQKNYPWISHIYFIPCLCHRINNAYKNAVIHSEPLSNFTSELHNIALACKEHKDELKKVCPTFISTRWIYDYDIARFITINSDHIKQFIHVPDDIEQFLQTVQIFKILVLTCEKTTQPFYTAFRLIEKSIITLNKLEKDGFPFIDLFKNNLLRQTFDSEEGGIWILSYLLTVEGHDDFYHRIHIGDLSPPDEMLDKITPQYSSPIDPLEQEVQWILERYIESIEAEDIDHEEDKEYIMGEEEINEEEDYEHIHKSSSYIEKAKKALDELLKLDGYLDNSRKYFLRMFNTYLDAENPFPNYRVSDQIGFSWLQIRVSETAYAPIANLALKLHSASLSEASCERTISAQRLIFNARRRRSANTETLEARLTIMRSDPNLNINL